MSRLAVATFCALLGLLAVSTPVSAQSDVWEDIDRLRSQGEALEREYDALLERVQSRAAKRSSSGSITSQRIGGSTYHSGSVGGETVSGTTQSMGSFDYTDLRVGERSYSATSQEIGNFEYTTPPARMGRRP